MKFHTGAGVHDVITHANFSDHRLMVFLEGSAGRIFPLSIDFRCRPCQRVINYYTFQLNMY